MPYAFAPPTTQSSVPSSSSRFSSTLGRKAGRPATVLSETAPLPAPRWFGTQPHRGQTPTLDPDMAAQPTFRRPLKLNSGLAMRQRNLPNKKTRHSPMPPHTSSPDWSVKYNTEVDRTLKVKLMRTISEKPMPYCIKFSSDCQLLAVVGSDGVVTIYNVATGEKICQLKDLYVKEDAGRIYDITFSSNGKYLATCSGSPDNIIRVWEVDKRHARNVFTGHFSTIMALDFSPDGRFLVSGSFDMTVRIWNMRDGSSRILDDSSYVICSVRFSPDGRYVAAGAGAGVLIWELRSGDLKASLNGHTDIIYSVDFMPNGEALVSGSCDKTLKYWDISWSTSDSMSDVRGAKQKERWTFVGQAGSINSVSVSPSGQWIASRSKDCSVCIWNTRTRSQQCILQAHEEDVLSVHFSPAGRYFASADCKGTVRIWMFRAFVGHSIVSSFAV